jgi:hypothetical protein
MSTHGRSGIGRWLCGSVADAVIRSATVPVMLIPSDVRGPWPTDRQPRILVLLDGSQLSEAVPIVYSDPIELLPYDPEEQLDEVRTYLALMTETSVTEPHKGLVQA